MALFYTVIIYFIQIVIQLLHKPSTIFVSKLLKVQK